MMAWIGWYGLGGLQIDAVFGDVLVLDAILKNAQRWKMFRNLQLKQIGWDFGDSVWFWGELK